MKILLKNVCIKFEDVNLFDKMNLTFEEGKSYAIFGFSGSGKSTLLNLISGVIEPDSGEIIVDDIKLEKINSLANKKIRKNYINYIFQNFALIDDESIYDNLKIVCKQHSDKELIKEALLKVNLKKDINTKIYKLSGGEQQRVAIARFYLRNTPIVLADEPTGNLDKKNSEEVIKLLLSEKENKIIIIVTHDEKVAEQCDVVVRLGD